MAGHKDEIQPPAGGAVNTPGRPPQLCSSSQTPRQKAGLFCGTHSSAGENNCFLTVLQPLCDFTKQRCRRTSCLAVGSEQRVHQSAVNRKFSGKHECLSDHRWRSAVCAFSNSRTTGKHVCFLICQLQRHRRHSNLSLCRSGFCSCSPGPNRGSGVSPRPIDGKSLRWNTEKP